MKMIELFILIIFVMVLLSIEIYAIDYSTDPQDYVFADFGDRMRNGTFSNTPADADGLSTARYSYTTNDCVYDDDLQKNGNMSIKCYSTGVGLFLNQFNFGSALNGITINYEYYSLDQSGEFIAKIKTGGEDVVLFGLNSAVGGGSGYFYDCGGGGVESDILKPNDWVNISAEVASDSTWTALRFNGTVVCNRTTGYTGNATGIYWHMQNNIDVILDNILVWNGSVTNRPLAISADATSPIINTTINNTSPKFNEIINISGNSTDEIGLSFCQIITNQTGNNDFFNFSLLGKTGKCSQNFTISLTRGNVINFTILVNDTNNNIAINDTLITVANTKPIAVNVSITPLPITAGDDLKGHCNFSDIDGDSYGGNFSYWYVNKTLILEANDTDTLLGGNVTELANITRSCRVNDTFIWSNWVNSSTANVGDTTAPTISNLSISDTTPYSDENVNISCKVIDTASGIGFVKVEINHTNYTMTSLNNNYYQFVQTWGVSVRNITAFWAKDGSDNIKGVEGNISFTVTTTPSGNGGNGDEGGGGGGIPFVKTCKDWEVLIGGECVNSSSFNITFRVVGLKNIEPIIFYVSCGKEQEYRYQLRTNKIIKNASWEKQQMNTELKITASSVLIIKKIKPLGFWQYIDMGKLRVVDTTNQVIFVSVGLRIVSICNPTLWVSIAIIGVGIWQRKKITKFIKKIIKK